MGTKDRETLADSAAVKATVNMVSWLIAALGWSVTLAVHQVVWRRAR